MTTLAVPPLRAPIQLRLRPANRRAEALTGWPYLSHSQLTTFRCCPKKIAYQYVENVPREFLASSLMFGSALQVAIELYFRRRQGGWLEDGSEGACSAEMLEAFLASWREQTAAAECVPVRFNKGEDMGVVTAAAARMISAFLSAPISEQAGRIRAVEEQFTVTLDDEIPDVLARVNLVTQTDDALVVQDFKTSRTRWN